MTASRAGHTEAAPRWVLRLYALTPIALFVAAVGVRAALLRPSYLAVADVLAAIAFALWSSARLRRFFGYRRRLAASGDSFPATLVSNSSGSLVHRSLWRRYVILRVPGGDDQTRIRLRLLFAQRTGRLEDGEVVRVRGRESGEGPLVVSNPVDGTMLIGRGRRFDPDQPGPLRLAWLVVRRLLRAFTAETRRGIRVVRHIPGAVARGAVAAGKGLLPALVVLAHGLGRGAAAAIVVLVRTVVALPRAVVTGSRSVVTRARAVVTRARAVGRALVRLVLGLAPQLVPAVRGLVRGLVAAVRGLVRGAAALARSLARVAVAAFVLAVAAFVLAVAAFVLAVRAVAALPRAFVIAARTAGRALRRVPSLLARTIRGVPAVARRGLRWLAGRRVPLLYLGVFSGLSVVILIAASFSARSRSTAPALAMVLVFSTLFGLGGLWFLVRIWRHWQHRRHITDGSERAMARVLWVRSRQGLGRLLGPERLALELSDAGATPLLLVSLFWQPRPHLSSGQEIPVAVTPGKFHGPVALQPGGWPSLMGYGRHFGPYKMVAPDVVRQARRTLRRDLIVFPSLYVKLVSRHRTFRHILHRGSHAVPAAVVGATRPRWYERFNERDSVWLRLDSPDGPRYVTMRLLGRQDATTLIAGEVVTLYGLANGSGSIIAVGSRRRSTLLGVGEPWSVSERNGE